MRKIVKAAFKVDELRYQFQDIDVPDGLLKYGTEDEVNSHPMYTDSYIIGEAHNRLDIAEGNQQEACWREDARQLRNFIIKWTKEKGDA